jgi:hypothetical protein
MPFFSGLGVFILSLGYNYCFCGKIAFKLNRNQWIPAEDLSPHRST